MDKLEIGGGSNPAEGYLTLDINPDCSPDITGDVKAFFSPDVEIEDYPDLSRLNGTTFNEIRVVHFIEHIEWIYQKPMFHWIYEKLNNRGKLVIETPNLEWIAKSYLKNRRSGEYPDEHPSLDGRNDFVPWVNFKLFSGCSPGDYHHTMYDKVWLTQVLRQTGFAANVRPSGSTLYAVGLKKVDIPEEEEYYASNRKRDWLGFLKMGQWIR